MEQLSAAKVYHNLNLEAVISSLFYIKPLFSIYSFYKKKLDLFFKIITISVYAVHHHRYNEGDVTEDSGTD